MIYPILLIIVPRYLLLPLHHTNTIILTLISTITLLLPRLFLLLLLLLQHTYAQTVEILRSTLQPFNDIEQISTLLGIPFDTLHLHTNSNTTTNNTNTTSTTSTTTLDPRSTEFKEILTKISKTAIYLKTHNDIMDAKRYIQYLHSLEIRITSIITRNMNEIIEKITKQCIEINEQKIFNKYKRKNDVIIDMPIESMPIYQKFRSISYRLRELSSLLLKGPFYQALLLNNLINNSKNHSNNKNKLKYYTTTNNNNNTSTTSTGVYNVEGSDLEIPLLTEVKEGYVVYRNQLLLSFMRDQWISTIETIYNTTTSSSNNNSSSSTSSNNSSSTTSTSSSINNTNYSSGIDLINIFEENKLIKSHSTTITDTTSTTNTTHKTTISLCTGIRQAFSILLRITQLELQLFESLFVLPTTTSSGSSSTMENNLEESSPRTPRTPTTPITTTTNSTTNITIEVNSIVQSIANHTRDYLRPFIIRESSVDELCRVVAALSEDVRSQMLGKGEVVYGIGYIYSVCIVYVLYSVCMYSVCMYSVCMYSVCIYSISIVYVVLYI